MRIPTVSFNPENALTAQEMREVDRVAVEEFNLQILQMMELAAFHMATLIREVMGGLQRKRALVVAGKGNNGGDAIACARFLHNWGAKVRVVAPEELNDNARHHLELVKKIGISVTPALYSNEVPDFVIDGLFGYAISGDVRSPFREQIEHINGLNIPIFSYDIPSGLDPNDGSVHGAAVRATHTLTFAYPKKGLFKEEAKPYVGKLYLADIGIPEAVYGRVRQNFPEVSYQNLFIKSPLLKIRGLAG